jgi:hypothetical protein
MKIINKLSLLVIFILAGTVLSAQTADDVIARYLDAIGGKRTIRKIKSMYVEGTMDIMGMEGTTSPDNIVSEHFFDKESGLLIRSVEPGEMGQNIATFSDYREIEGYTMPYKIEIDAGGQAMIYATYNKVELNVPVDESIFAKPE